MKALLTSEFNSLLLNLSSKQQYYEIVLNDFGIRKNAKEFYNDCISKRKALNKCKDSDGLLIKKKRNNVGFTFHKFYKNVPIQSNEFAIEKDIIERIFNGNSLLQSVESTEVRSLIFFVLSREILIFELSSNLCNDDGSGGDGVKVKIPTE